MRYLGDAVRDRDDWKASAKRPSGSPASAAAALNHVHLVFDDLRGRKLRRVCTMARILSLKESVTSTKWFGCGDAINTRARPSLRDPRPAQRRVGEGVAGIGIDGSDGSLPGRHGPVRCGDVLLPIG